MNSIQSLSVPRFLLAITLALAVAAPAWAALGFPGQTPVTGIVQNIDYLHHAITVNGQTYAVASDASFKGIGGFSVLHVGMPIAYLLGNPSSNNPGDTPATQSRDNPQPVITHITWLPGGI